MINFFIHCNVSECEARGLTLKVGKSENSADGRYSLTQTHSWRTAQCSLSTDPVFRKINNGPSASLTVSTREYG